ncbi:BnaC05g26310D [Brassica napus]|uniref:BnaC05g26310D protein n=1 Tax=Brassica napus TaxID=3708 RepID=A0A078G5W6_BRANA|nr:BnaC05g26310D [Brassica napus]
MIPLLITPALQLAELLVSSVVHILFGLYLFSSAIAGDLTQTLVESVFKPKPTIEVKQGNTTTAQVNDLTPIVLVHGIFGFGKGRLGGLSYFAGAEKKDERVLVPDLGSLTSVHDRARELFYYLKGGRVDYGEDHSKTCGHSQFGRFYDKGEYQEWDEDHPIHFVGHSAGAQVVRVLQQMLADEMFDGHENTNENWVLSLTSLSGALNRGTRTYLDGIQPEDGKSLKPICLLQICRFGSIIYDWLDISWLKSYYNFGFDHFNMSWKKTGLRGLVDCLLGNAGPFASSSGDWILPDLSIQETMKLNANLKTFPNTFYFSYATKRTRKPPLGGVMGIHPLLSIRGYRDEDWQDNDGALNTISMTHPRIPVEHSNLIVQSDSDCLPLQPGIWYYKIVEADHILFIVNRERAGVEFDLIYDSIFERCRKHVFRKSPQTLPNEAQQQQLGGDQEE